MLRWHPEGYLPILAVAISLVLTGLTVSTVLYQGRTLEAREAETERRAADRMIIEREQAFRNDLVGWFAEVGGARRSSVRALDAWVTEQRFWWMVCVADSEGETTTFPLTPTEAPFPSEATEALSVGEDAEFIEHDPAAALTRYERLAETEDDAMRAQALLAAAANQRKLREFQAACSAYLEAAGLMATQAGSLRGVFGARLAAVDCLLDDADIAGAHRQLETLLKLAADAHPAALGSAEVALLQRRLAAIDDGGEVTARLGQALAAAATRARGRGLVGEVTAALGRMAQLGAEGGGDIGFTVIDPPREDPMLVATRRIGQGRRAALATPLKSVITRYWRGEHAPARWWVQPRSAVRPDETYCELPACFGRLVLQPSQVSRAELRSAAWWRMALLITVTGGTAGAWGIVIWMLFRVLARQRELVQLQRRFVADVSHELKTPLALIRLLADTLVAGRVRTESRMREYHHTIARESERLTLLLENILDFSRIELGRKQYEFTECDVGEVAQQAWKLFAPRLAEDGFTTELSVADDLPTIEADPQALSQVIINLLQNAHRYAGDELFIRLAVWQQRDEICICVEDHGLGMSRSMIRKIGRSFERGTDTRVRRQRGTGLGLAIVRHIMAAHDGHLEVRSIPEQGSTFTVRLPVERKTQ